VAKLLGVPSIYTNDNEHAKGNWPAFLCANKIFLPEFLTYDDISMPFISRKKVLNYDGVKEGIYLWNEYLDYEYKKVSSVPTIYIRLEPNLAQYYNAGLFFMDDLIIALKDKYNIVIIPREKSQIKHYEALIFEGITVLTKPQPLSEIVKKCSLFIGAGGTMTREMAVIGVPTISVYQDELLKVDEYLIRQGLMVHVKKLTIDYVDNFLKETVDNKRNTDILKKGYTSYCKVKQLLINNLY
jgi:predicted glycosyltransferase